jgi:hypothetical protein
LQRGDAMGAAAREDEQRRRGGDDRGHGIVPAIARQRVGSNPGEQEKREEGVRGQQEECVQQPHHADDDRLRQSAPWPRAPAGRERQHAAADCVSFDRIFERPAVHVANCPSAVGDG